MKRFLNWVRSGGLRYWAMPVLWVLAVTIIAVIAFRGCNSHDSTMESAPLMSVGHNQPLDSISYEGFKVLYNSAWHLPACVAYELTGEHTDGPVPRYDDFWRDSTVSACPDADAFKGSGYDRGHMMPASDAKWNATIMRNTFRMTNICPQDHSLNEGAWQKLEEKVREWARRDGALIVLAGPVVTNDNTSQIGDDHVRVPHAFYKVVLAPQCTPVRAIAFIFPNQPCHGHLDDYATTIDKVESLTGLDFFAALPDDVENRIEAKCNLNPWIK
ncbi:MAG: DNA/RNA non-specific endonuclease [Bacteroidales bacterium]|nr:DNA/RNA non-specific endonuclease [Candidatus Sodaliphilus aphodohippi]